MTSVSPWTFTWTYGVASLDASAVTGSAVTVVFDLLQGGYAAFDNLSIVASQAANVVDGNNSGIPDDQEGCGLGIPRRGIGGGGAAGAGGGGGVGTGAAGAGGGAGGRGGEPGSSDSAALGRLD